jgi:prepilin-type N-terminal cleavage/methylation domain-containing protein
MQSAECRLRNVKARNPAFTLIELLVVLAVILVLAGLLLPVLVNARARSVRTQCLSNIKQVDMVFLMYGHDNRDRLPQGGLLTVLPAAIADMAVRDGISHRVFYDPGVVNQVKVGLLSRDITGDWFTNFIAIPDRDRKIAYCLTLPGIYGLLPTNVNATIIPQPISPGMNMLLPPPNASERVLVAGVVSADVKTGAIPYGYYDQNVDGYVFNMWNLFCAHLNSKGTRPLGDNLGMLDGSAKWRQFKDMVPRTGAPGGNPFPPGVVGPYW